MREGDTSDCEPGRPAKIVVVAGAMKAQDRIGHHDYLAGCRLAAALLQQTQGVATAVAQDGWPEDDAILDDARAIVFYSGGAQKHAFLQSVERLDLLQRLVYHGVGIVMIHQAVRFPAELAARAASWIGGAHVGGKAGRGHWATRHERFPSHPVTCGVAPWTITDGWLNEIQFVPSMRGVTPLLWSSRHHAGSDAGGAADVVAWAYERPGGGRSFCFTGLDAHEAWLVPGVRQLIVNGILWSAGVPVPVEGASATVAEGEVRGYLTPRTLPAIWSFRAIRRQLRRLTERGHY